MDEGAWALLVTMALVAISAVIPVLLATGLP